MSIFFDVFIIFGILLMSFDGMISRWKLSKKVTPQERFFQVGLSIILGVWGLFYIAVLLDINKSIPPLDVLITRAWIVRPLILITLTLINTAGKARSKMNGH